MRPAAHALDQQVLDALQDSVDGRARAGRVEDAVSGVAVDWVAEPADTEQVAALLTVAAQRSMSVVARGSGTRLGWGAAPRSANLLVSLAAMNQVLEHEAGDLVVHAQAGTRLEDLQSTLRPSNQHLALDPPSAPGADRRGTVGGVIATAASGPLRLSHGGVRDLLIGVTMVRADGRIAHAGGKVVKNVAGYDLGKLLTGSWGTLAVITEARFRLHPISPVSRWLTFSLPDAERANALIQQVIHSQLCPAALEIDRPERGPATLALQLSGTEAGVEARIAQVADVRAEVSASPPVWSAELPWSPGGVGLRLTHELTGLPVLLAELDEATARAGAPRACVRGAAGVGLLHAGLRGDVVQAGSVVARLRERAAAWGGEVVVLDAPAEVRASVDLWGPVRGLSLMRRVKDQFDPEHRLAPGRFVGGI